MNYTTTTKISRIFLLNLMDVLEKKQARMDKIRGERMIETIQGVTILQTIEPTTDLSFLCFLTIVFAFFAVLISAIILNTNDELNISVPLMLFLIFISMFYGWFVIPKFAETKQSYRCRIESVDAYRELTEHCKILDEYDGIYLVR